MLKRESPFVPIAQSVRALYYTPQISESPRSGDPETETKFWLCCDPDKFAVIHEQHKGSYIEVPSRRHLSFVNARFYRIILIAT